MPPCYVVFEGKKPGIYFSWYECAKVVLRDSGAIYQKYNNYDDTLRDFNARVPQEPLLLPIDASHGDASASHELVTAKEGSQTYPHSPTIKTPCCCKNVVIFILFLVVVSLSIKLFMCRKCCLN
jgi:hypothetical protein